MHCVSNRKNIGLHMFSEFIINMQHVASYNWSYNSRGIYQGFLLQRGCTLLIGILWRITWRTYCAWYFDIFVIRFQCTGTFIHADTISMLFHQSVDLWLWPTVKYQQKNFKEIYWKKWSVYSWLEMIWKDIQKFVWSWLL